MITETRVNIHYIGHEALDLPVLGMTDDEVLAEASKLYPKGLNLHGSNLGPVWVWPTMLLNLSTPDGFGLELQGMAHTAAELLRLAADPEKATELGGMGVDRLVSLFAAQTRNQSVAKRPNQLHGHRWGASAKVVASDLVSPYTIEVHPEGRVAGKLAKLFGCTPGATGGWADLEDQYILVLRHPFIYSYVAQIKYNLDLTKNLVLANRLDWRRALQADSDGDTAAMFGIKSRVMALMIHDELVSVVPDSDVTALVLDRPCHEDAEWWGEMLDKTTDQKLDQHFTRSIAEWINTHLTMGDYANKFTPFAYRISDVGGAMAAVGIPGAREAALMGATIEETFYLGLGGGPKQLDEALETWFKKKMTKANQNVVLAGLNQVVSPELMTDNTVLLALCRASAINRGNFDMNDPQELLVHLAFLVGKGKLTLEGEAMLEQVVAIAGDPSINPELRESFITKMLFHAGRKLSQVVGKGNPVGNVNRDNYQQDDTGENYDTGWEE